MNVSIVGVDLAKNIFQIHAIDEGGEVIVRRALRRRQMIPFFTKLKPCLVGMEACGTSQRNLQSRLMVALTLVAAGSTTRRS